MEQYNEITKDYDVELTKEQVDELDYERRSEEIEEKRREYEDAELQEYINSNEYVLMRLFIEQYRAEFKEFCIEDFKIYRGD